jgi:hypothetical protein
MSAVRLYLHYICVTFVCYSSNRCHVIAADMRHIRDSASTYLLGSLVTLNVVELVPHRERDGGDAYLVTRLSTQVRETQSKRGRQASLTEH